MNLQPNFLARGGLVLVLAGLMAASPLGAGPLLAQSQAERPTLIKHLRTELRSKDDVRQERALIDVIALAGCQASCTVALQSKPSKALQIENETGTGNVIDLEVLTPDILRAYRNGSADGYRLLALSALINIGGETAIDKLVGEKETQNSRVRRVTDMSLAAFYFAKYPELMERSTRNRTLSLDDVEQARVLRLRAAKRAEKRGGR